MIATRRPFKVFVNVSKCLALRRPLGWLHKEAIDNDWNGVDTCMACDQAICRTRVVAAKMSERQLAYVGPTSSYRWRGEHLHIWGLERVSSLFRIEHMTYTRFFDNIGEYSS